MKKLLIGTALLFAALPFTFDGVTPAVSKAQAAHRQRVVIPLTQATVPPWGLPTPHWNAPIYAPTPAQFLCIIRQPAMVATRPPLASRFITVRPGIKLAFFLGPARSGHDAEWRDC